MDLRPELSGDTQERRSAQDGGEGVGVGDDIGMRATTERMKEGQCGDRVASANVRGDEGVRLGNV